MRTTTLCTLTLALALTGHAQSPEVLLRSAMDKETVDGDLKAAIEQYKKVLAKAGSNRAVAAQALVRLGVCYEHQGNSEARKTYDRVLREYSDQADAVTQARGRLSGLGTRAASTALTVRQVWPSVDRSVRLWGDISPDGRYLSHTVWGNGDLAVRDLETGQSRLVTRFPDGNKDGVEFSKFSPDGRRIAFSWETKDRWELRVINFDGTGMKTIYTTKRHVDPDGWSPDGGRVLATDWQRGQPDRLIWVHVADGAVQNIKSVGGAKVSPDGRTLAYRSGDEIRTMASDGSGDTLVGSQSGLQAIMGWSPDSKHLLITRANGAETGLWALPMDGGKSAGNPGLIRRELGARVQGLGISRSGSVYYQTSEMESDIYTADLDPATGRLKSKPQLVPVNRSGSNVLPRWSPSGRELAYVWAKGERAISTYSFETRQTRQLLSTSIAAGPVCWADPDSIRFTATSSPGIAWVRMDLSTSVITRLHQWPSGSRFGRNCGARGKNVVTADIQGVHLLDVSTGIEKKLYEMRWNPAMSLPSLSPDGSLVAFIEGGRLVVVNQASGVSRDLLKLTFPVVFQTLYGISWSPDSRYIYFAKQTMDEELWELFRIPVTGGAEESTGLKVPGLRDLAVSPDGARIAFSAGGTTSEVWAIDNPVPGLN